MKILISYGAYVDNVKHVVLDRVVNFDCSYNSDIDSLKISVEYNTGIVDVFTHVRRLEFLE